VEVRADVCVPVEPVGIRAALGRGRDSDGSASRYPSAEMPPEVLQAGH
jgi:hypothetical protein